MYAELANTEWMLEGKNLSMSIRKLPTSNLHDLVLNGIDNLAYSGMSRTEHYHPNLIHHWDPIKQHVDNYFTIVPKHLRSKYKKAR